MPTMPLRIVHPTDSRPADGDADIDLTLRDVCLDLQRGDFLATDQKLNELTAVLERTNATLPMTVPIKTLGLQANDTIQLAKATTGAGR